VSGPADRLDPGDGPGSTAATPTSARPLRLARLARQLSQEQLAHLAGVSRQAVAGFESGRFDPSLAVALRLARALGRSVEELFGLPGQPTDWQVRWAVPPPLGPSDRGGPTGPVRAAVVEVSGETWAFPLVGPAAFSSGVAVANGRIEASEADVAVVRAPGPTVVVAGCDPALALLGSPLADRDPPLSVLWWPCSSAVALALAQAGAVHAAGVHRPAGARQATIELARTALGSPGGAVVGFAGWPEGLAVAEAWADRVRSVADLSALDAPFANREVGAEARQLVADACGQAGVDPRRIPGWSSALAGHVAVAQAVAGGVAAAGVTTGPVARTFALPFLALADEEFELVVPRRQLVAPEVQHLLAALGSADLREQLAAFPGYDLTACGEVVATF
jgi:putative molybdopterin biosynthesis protein